jgi:heterodisulfide reductase subunit A-like polyferredoxin
MKKIRRVIEDHPETWIYDVSGYLGTNGVRYSKKYFSVQNIGGKQMIIGDVAEYEENSDGLLKVRSARVKPVAEYAGNY